MNANSNKMHPLNNDVLIIYLIGGITSYEYKIVKEIFKEQDLSQKVNILSNILIFLKFFKIYFVKILIGSSHFYNHNKLVKYIFN